MFNVNFDELNNNLKLKFIYKALNINIVNCYIFYLINNFENINDNLNFIFVYILFNIYKAIIISF